MKVIGFGLKKISAEKKDLIKDKLEINTDIQIVKIYETKIELLKETTPLEFDFDLNIKYNPNIASIAITGFVVISVDKKEAKEILKKWEKKEIEDNLRLEILNFVIAKTNLKALQIEEDLDIPYHMPFPRVSKKNQTDK
jgi:hypothetical protein